MTIQQYPVGFIKSLSGIVCARSVKLLSSVGAAEQVHEQDARDKWWIEIRNEIRSHMKSLNCHVVAHTPKQFECKLIIHIYIY